MNPTDFTNGFTRPLGDGQDPESAPDGPDVQAVLPSKHQSTIKHRHGSGKFKAHPAYQQGGHLQLGIDPQDVQKIAFSISDHEMDGYLDQVGVQLLCLCPLDALKAGVGFEIPGRNAYAVKTGVFISQFHWPGAREFVLMLVPDTVDDTVEILPPEYVQMLTPTKLVQFHVVAGL